VVSVFMLEQISCCCGSGEGTQYRFSGEKDMEIEIFLYTYRRFALRQTVKNHEIRNQVIHGL
jgi:hypothetical protein